MAGCRSYRASGHTACCDYAHLQARRGATRVNLVPQFHSASGADANRGPHIHAHRPQQQGDVHAHACAAWLAEALPVLDRPPRAGCSRSWITAAQVCPKQRVPYNSENCSQSEPRCAGLLGRLVDRIGPLRYKSISRQFFLEASTGSRLCQAAKRRA